MTAPTLSETGRAPGPGEEGKWARRRRMAVAWALLPVAVLPGVWISGIDWMVQSDSGETTDSERSVALNALSSSGAVFAVIFAVVFAAMAAFLGRSRVLSVAAVLTVLAVVVVIPWGAVKGLHENTDLYSPCPSYSQSTISPQVLMPLSGALSCR